MKQWLLLLRTEVKCQMNRKSWIWITILVLITLLISTFSHTRSQEENAAPTAYIKLGIVNQDTSEYASLLLSYFTDNQDFSEYVEITEGEEAVLKQQMEAGKLDCLLIIPKGFAEQMILMEHQPIQVFMSTVSPTKAVLLNNVLKSYETYIAAVEVNCAALFDKMKEDGFSYEERNQTNINLSLELVFTALGKDNFFSRREIAPIQEVSLTDQYFFSGVFMLLLFAFFPIGLHSIKRQNNGLARRIYLGNTSDAAQLLEVIVPYVIGLGVGMAALFLLPVFDEEHSLWQYVVCIALCLPVLLFIMAFGLLCKKRQTYLLLCSVLLLVLALTGGSLIPPRYLPNLFLPLTERMPNYLFVMAASGTMKEEIAGKIVLCCTLCAVVQFVGLQLLMKIRREGSKIEE